MRIRKVQISNLRAIADATVEFDDYTCLVGANGAGKSTVLFALNVLFREADAQGNPLAVLAEEDFHRRDTSRPASVTVWFEQLSAEAQEDFKDYYRNGFLVVTAAATFDEAKGKAEIKQFGQRMAMAEFAEYFGRIRMTSPFLVRRIMVTRWRFANQPWLRDINRLEHQKANGDILGHWLRPSHQEASQATLESRRPAVRHRQVVADSGLRRSFWRKVGARPSLVASLACCQRRLLRRSP